MLNRTEVERLAAMAHQLRPDWPVRSLCTFLATDHTHRAYRDVAVALAWIATDPATHTPRRMNELGPWWQAVAHPGSPAGDAVPRPDDARCEDHPWERASRCRACSSERLAGPDNDLTPPAPPAPHPPGTGPALVRAAMRVHGIPTEGAS